VTTSEFVQATILKATGKATVLTSSDTKWIKIVAIGNRLIKKWERLADWNSLYTPDYPGGTITATDSFELDDEIRKLSDTDGDYVRIVNATDSNIYYDYTVVNAERLKQYTVGRYCAQMGRNLVFNKIFTTTDPEYGGEIQLPVYLFADELTTATSEVPVDDPEWLVCLSAGEYVRNDITKQNQYPNLVTEANEILEIMMDDNDGQIIEVYRPWSAGT
jgi:hypothetical protein